MRKLRPITASRIADRVALHSMDIMAKAGNTEETLVVDSDDHGEWITVVALQLTFRLDRHSHITPALTSNTVFLT